MKHKVLILGTLGEFTELVKKAKEKGYETVVCDGYADGIARTYADKAYTIPVTDVDAIALMCREEGVDGIITSFSDLLLSCLLINVHFITILLTYYTHYITFSQDNP